MIRARTVNCWIDTYRPENFSSDQEYSQWPTSCALKNFVLQVILSHARPLLRSHAAQVVKPHTILEAVDAVEDGKRKGWASEGRRDEDEGTSGERDSN